MFLEKTLIEGVCTIDQEIKSDERGFFSRVFCADVFKDLGLDASCVQVNSSFSRKKKTLRGMHYQIEPYAETKLVFCVKGSLYDVVLDLRLDSMTFGRYVGRELSSKNRRMMYVPKGCAHGFFTLEDDTEMLYVVSSFYHKEAERGVRWNDPLFHIDWPDAPEVISKKDQSYPDFPTSSA